MLGIGSSAQSLLGEYVPRLPFVRDGHGFAGFAKLNLWILERKQDLVIDLVAQAPHDFLEDREVEHEPAFLVERALDGDARAVVVPVQSLAPVAGERDEVRRREHQIVLRHRYAELTAVHRVLRQKASSLHAQARRKSPRR